MVSEVVFFPRLLSFYSPFSLRKCDCSMRIRSEVEQLELSDFLDYYLFILLLLFESSKVRLFNGNKKRTRN